MAKLHELLAVDGNLEAQANKTRTDLIATFHSKRHLFEQKLVTFTPIAEGQAAVTESQSDIESTIAKEIKWVSGILAKALDGGYHIDLANTQAKADVVTEDGDVLLKDMPATALLQLEKRVVEIQQLAAAIPTLDPAKGFAQDDNREPGIFQARPVTKARTKKTPTPLVMAPATKEHAAQVQLVNEDVVTGTIREQEWSALITPAMKSDIIDRCDVLLRAIKKARAKANEVELDVGTHKIGKKLLDFIFQPLYA
jgi:hypothetical protein